MNYEVSSAIIIIIKGVQISNCITLSEHSLVLGEKIFYNDSFKHGGFQLFYSRSWKSKSCGPNVNFCYILKDAIKKSTKNSNILT